MSARAVQNTAINRHKVLIVDDHPFVRAGLKQVIEDQPDFVVCAEAGTAPEALAALRQHAPDLAVVDLSLEGDNGLELIKKMRTREQRVRILVLSMHDESLHAERILRAGAQGYIMKRESPRLFLAAMRQVVNGQCYVSPAMAGRLTRHYAGRRKAEKAAPHQRLSNRELEVFLLVGEGHRRTEIAKLLSLSAKTVETHFERIKTKLGYQDAQELRLQAFLLAQEKKTARKLPLR